MLGVAGCRSGPGLELFMSHTLHKETMKKLEFDVLKQNLAQILVDNQNNRLTLSLVNGIILTLEQLTKTEGEGDAPLSGNPQ